MEEASFPSSFSDHYYPITDNCTLTDLFGSSPLGFMELLNSTQDVGPSIFDVFQPLHHQPLIHYDQDYMKPKISDPSEVFNTPATPNTSSVSSESNDHEQTTKEEEEDDDENHKSKKTLKAKKTSLKRQREPRFAFMTKSDVDHLEDGYRWRKYGQKAVKNSPFPRSYYRCTNSSCNVKKRVERSFDDRSIVVTTYEGQHTHPSPHLSRPMAVMGPPPSYSGFSADIGVPVFSHNHIDFNNYSVLLNSCGYNGLKNAMPMTQSNSRPLTDHGLLQDVVPWSLVKKEE